MDNMAFGKEERVGMLESIAAMAEVESEELSSESELHLATNN